MTAPDNPARHLAVALDAFLAEHRGCWRLHGKGLQCGKDDLVISGACGGYRAALVIPWAVP
jgi:hypothetical protein